MTPGEFANELAQRWQTKGSALVTDAIKFAQQINPGDLPALLQHILKNYDGDFFPRAGTLKRLAQQIGTSTGGGGSYDWVAECPGCGWRWTPDNLPRLHLNSAGNRELCTNCGGTANHRVILGGIMGDHNQRILRASKQNAAAGTV